MSSGGTAATLREAGVEVTEVADVTGFPEMLGGRVKTLHPAIHGGLLADQRDAEHLAQIAELGIEPFDLLVSNLYPFRETVASGASFEDTIEKIDIGGPAMVRAGAKNLESVAVIVNPERYETVLDELKLEGGMTRATRFALAAEAFAHTAAYDAAVGGWFAQQQADGDALPGFVGRRVREGRGPALRREPASARRAVRGGRGPGCVRRRRRCFRARRCRSTTGSTRGPPTTSRSRCPSTRASSSSTTTRAASRRCATRRASYRGAFACDEVSAFGGIVAFHGPCDEAAAEAMREVFTEVVIAPAFTRRRAGGVRRPGPTCGWCRRR